MIITLGKDDDETIREAARQNPWTGSIGCDDLLAKERKKHARLRKTVRQFIDEIAAVPMRAVDCNQNKVDELLECLIKLSNYRG